MRAELVPVDDRVAAVAAVCLWVAVLARLPSALRHPSQRGVWCAAVGAALAMTFCLPGTERLLAQSHASRATAVLTRDVAGVASAAAVLYLADAVAGTRRLLPWTCGALGVTVAALQLAPAAAGHPADNSSAGPAQGLVVLLLIFIHLVANARCLAMCWRYGRSGPAPLTSALGLLGLGAAIALPYWAIGAVLVFVPAHSAVPVIPFLPPLQCLLAAMAVLVPMVAAAHRSVVDARTIWRLWPLWRGLIDAVPEAALNSPRSRLREVLWPGLPRRFLMYRKLIEIRNALLVLRRHIDTTTAQAARSHVAAARLPESLTEATVLACLVRESCRSRIAGNPELPQPYEITGPAIDNLGQEKAFLLQLAAAYDHPLARVRLTAPSEPMTAASWRTGGSDGASA